MRKRLTRLFTIKTRTEALLVTYAIAVGAIERGFHYMDQYPGYAGVVLALACLGVPFIAGAKLIDSVRPEPAAGPARVVMTRRREERRFGRKAVMAGNRGAESRPTRRRLDRR